MVKVSMSWLASKPNRNVRMTGPAPEIAADVRMGDDDAVLAGDEVEQVVSHGHHGRAPASDLVEAAVEMAFVLHDGVGAELGEVGVEVRFGGELEVAADEVGRCAHNDHAGPSRRGRVNTGLVRQRLTIGEFSSITHLSVKTLRRYHENGLLGPAEVDEWTGYRYDKPGQIAAAQTIRRLRALDMPYARSQTCSPTRTTRVVTSCCHSTCNASSSASSRRVSRSPLCAACCAPARMRSRSSAAYSTLAASPRRRDQCHGRAERGARTVRRGHGRARRCPG